MMKPARSLLWMLFLAFLGSSCSEKIEPGTTNEAPKLLKNVSVATAHVSEEPVVYEAVGTVRAGRTVRLASKLLGTVMEVRVKEGTRVKRGDLLIVMDQRQVSAALRQAAAGLAEARKALAAARSGRDEAAAAERFARVDYERYVSLKRDDSVSQQEFDQVEARHRRAKAALAKAGAMVEAAQARVREAEARLAAARFHKADAQITAPEDGLITGKMVEPGDLAAPGTLLLTLESSKGFRVDMVLPEAYIGQIKTGQEVKVAVSPLKGRILRGKVLTIVPAGDPRTRSFLVKVGLPYGVPVKSGMFARVKIPIGSAGTLLIPRSAVIVHGQLTGIFLLDSDNIARFRLIRPGRSIGNRVEVLSGLREGERYLPNPAPGITNGVRVEVNP